MARTPTPIETFLAPLARIAARDPDIEAHVFWAKGGIWPDDPAEALESEEIAFYAEGLLVEGFRLIWQAIGTPGDGQDGGAGGGAGDGAEAILLFVSQDEAAPPPDYGPVLISGRWPV